MTKAGPAEEVRERPILFSGRMVRAILNGSKTQTRRVVKFPPHVLKEGTDWIKSAHRDGGGNWIFWSCDTPDLADFTRRAYPAGKGLSCPYGKPGDRLTVREGWRWYGRLREPGMVEGGFEYRADGEHRKFTDFADPDNAWEQFKAAAVNGAYHWRPSIHMPRWASRITLELTEVRVERLCDIGTGGVKAEGVECLPEEGTLSWAANCRERFGKAWDAINGKRPGCAWADSPWVWVLSFRRLKP